MYYTQKIAKVNVMQWFFIDNNIITDSDSGFKIELNAGSWQEPMEVAPYYSSSIPASEQVRLLRLGLKFAQEALSTQIAV